MNDCGCMCVCVLGLWSKRKQKMEENIRTTSIGDFERQLYISNVLCNASHGGKC